MKVLLLALALAHAGALAGPVSAIRYVDSQGVEVIHDRASEKQTVPGGLDARVTAGKPVESSARIDPKLQVSPSEQARRDLDRVAILEQELTMESQQYAAALQRLSAATPGAPVNADDTARLSQELASRQNNIKALHAELRRARMPSIRQGARP